MQSEDLDIHKQRLIRVVVAYGSASDSRMLAWSAYKCVSYCIAFNELRNRIPHSRGVLISLFLFGKGIRDRQLG